MSEGAEVKSISWDMLVEKNNIIASLTRERDEVLAHVAVLTEALKAADKLADLAVTLTGCQADDDHVASVKAAITNALSASPATALADLKKRIAEEEREACAKVAGDMAFKAHCDQHDSDGGSSGFQSIGHAIRKDAFEKAEEAIRQRAGR